MTSALLKEKANRLNDLCKVANKLQEQMMRAGRYAFIAGCGNTGYAAK
jgi:hypothetical protein